MIHYKAGDKLLSRGPQGTLLTGVVTEVKQRLIQDEYEDIMTVKMEDGTQIFLTEHNMINVERLED